MHRIVIAASHALSFPVSPAHTSFIVTHRHQHVNNNNIESNEHTSLDVKVSVSVQFKIWVPTEERDFSFSTEDKGKHGRCPCQPWRLDIPSRSKRQDDRSLGRQIRRLAGSDLLRVLHRLVNEFSDAGVV